MVPSKSKVCQKESVVVLPTPNCGDTRPRAAGEPALSENHECVGVCDCAVDHCQSCEPLSALWVQPARSKPPPESAPSKVSTSDAGANGPVGALLFWTVFVSSSEFTVSTARTT